MSRRGSSRLARQLPAAFVTFLALLIVALVSMPTGSAGFTSATASLANGWTMAASTCPTISASWVSGFESGVVSTAGASITPASSLLDAVVGGPTIDSSVKRGGTYSLKLTKTGSAAQYVTKNPPTPTAGAAYRFAVRFETLPSALVEIGHLKATTGTDVYLKYNPTVGRFQLSFGGASRVSSSSTVVAGRWYVLSGRFDLSANPHVADWSVDGVAQPQKTLAEAADTYGGIVLGSSITAEVYTANIDDVLVSGLAADYPLPDGRVAALSPDSYVGKNDPNSYLQTQVPAAVGSGDWSLIDDLPMTSTVDYINQTTSSTSAYAEFGFQDVPGTTCISGVSAVAAVNASSSAATLGKTSIFDSGTERVIHNDDFSPASGLEYRSLTIAPASGVWTAGRVNGLTARIGYRNAAGSAPYWHALLLEYDQVPAAGDFCQAPSTPAWVTGFESGVLSSAGATVTPAASLLSSIVGAGPTIDTATVHSGDYSLKIAKSNGGPHYANKIALGTPGNLVERLAFRFESLPTTAVELHRLSVSSTGTFTLRWDQATGKFTVSYVGSSLFSSTMTVSAGVWYVIDVNANVAANPHTVDWRVNGVVQPQASFAAAADTFTGQATYGSTANADVYNAYWDDILVSSSGADYPLPAGRVRSLVPNSYVGKSDTSGFLINDAGSAVGNGDAARLADRPMTSTSDYVTQTGNDAAAYAEFGFTDPLTPACVNAVSGVVAYTSSATPATNGKTSLLESGVERVLHNDDMSPGTGTLEYRSLAVGAGSGPWSATKLAGVTTRVGYRTGGTTAPRWQAVLIEYDQTPATGQYCEYTSPPSWVTGFESGVVSASGGTITPNRGMYSGISGTPTADTTLTRTGGYSLKIAKANGVQTWARRAPSVGGKGSWRFYLRFDDLPTASVTQLALIDATTTNDIGLQYDLATGFLKLRQGSGSITTGTMTIEADKWYKIDIASDLSVNPHVTTWWVDDNIQATNSSAEAADGISAFYLGSTNSADVYTAYYDDVLGTTDPAEAPLPAGAVRPLRPDSYVGKSDPSGYLQNDAGAGVGATDWNRLDESPLTSLTDYVQQTAVDASAYAEFGYENPASARCVNGVSAELAYASSTTTTNAAKTNVMEGSTENIVNNDDMSPGNAALEYRAFSFPSTAGNWTTGKINGLTSRLGYYSTAGGAPYWHGLLLQYDSLN